MSKENSKKKVLIIRLSSMGDVIFNVPLANKLKENGYEVSWLVGEKGLQILENNPSVDKVFFAPVEKWKKSKNILKNFYEYIEIIKNLRNEKFDIALDTQMLMKSIPFTMFCGAKRRIISKSAREFSFIGANEIIPRVFDKFNIPVVKAYLKYAEYLGLDVSYFNVTLPPSKEDDVNFVSDLLKDTDKTKQNIVIAPATTWVAKHWDKNNWRELIEKLKDKYNLIFSGGKNDVKLIDEIRNGVGLNLAGKTNLSQLIELLRNSDLLISLDSGTTHLGWATQIPKVISIFCCTPIGLYAPIGDKNKYVSLSGDLTCQPCHHKKCRLKEKLKNSCTKFPKPDEVFKYVQKFMENKN
ncbi:glycosyltransferase family 9 protein [bacterium]|nr:glycosyltransferase family 9 protein [bacterium]